MASISWVLNSLFSILLLTQRVNSESTAEKQALLTFLQQIPHENRLQWNESDSACNWVGVECNSNQSSIHSLRLPGTGLVGQIPSGSLGRLTELRVLSLRSNRLSGQIPSDFSNLTHLRSLYLQHNEFSGEFPTSFTQLNNLIRLDISSNNFTGSIPFSVNNLTHLTGLFLGNNGFSGNLPSISLGLVDFNVSNNNLNGSIPSSLSRFSAESFTGNVDLCGGPLKPCKSFFVSPSPSPSLINPSNRLSSKKSKLSKAAIVAIIVASALVALLLLALLLFLCLRKRRGSNEARTKQPKPAGVATRNVDLPPGASSSKEEVTGTSSGMGGETERNKLVFTEGGVYSFDLEDLLRASAEVLGKGSVGTSYKAVLEEGTTVVVKRLKDVMASKKEFETQMEVVGKIKHPNVIPLRAYYYSKDEKLLVFDFMPTGSLSALLHGSRGSGRTPLDWDNRMRIAITAARGLAHLHVSAKLVHGNIKASNILLHPNQDTCVSDYGLNQLFSNSSPPNRLAGYHAPEVLETRKVTFKSDVYSFGVLLLELLTGKSPNQASLGEEGIDLPRWVLSVVREEWTAEVFDVELMRYHNIEEEMVQLLQIAMACVSTVPDQRPVMQEVLRMIEDVNRSETTDDGLRQSSDDPSKGSEGQTPPGESRTPPRSSKIGIGIASVSSPHRVSAASSALSPPPHLFFLTTTTTTRHGGSYLLRQPTRTRSSDSLRLRVSATANSPSSSSSGGEIIENVVIIGSGPAGYTAAIYAARANLKPVVFEGYQMGGVPGGQLMTTTEVENFPGFPDGITGPDLMEKMRKQAERWGAELYPEDVESLSVTTAPFTVQTSERKVKCHSIIYATGATARRLRLPREEEFWSRGISACAICDGASPLFKGQVLAVVGGGDTATEEALYLTKYARHVHLLVRRDQLRASKAMQDRVINNPNITVHYNTETVDVLSNTKGQMSGILLRRLDTGEETELEAKGLFYGIGHSPNSQLLEGQVELDSSGYVLVREGTSNTSVEGVFAAGDVQDHEWRQAVTAAGSGCIAALSAERYLTSNNLLVEFHQPQTEEAKKEFTQRDVQEKFDITLTKHKGQYALRKLYHESPRVILVLYTSPTCGPCRTLKPILNKVVDEYNHDVHFVEIDIEEDQEIAEAAGIMGTPCVQFFKNKEMLRTISGVKMKKEYREFIEANK